MPRRRLTKKPSALAMDEAAGVIQSAVESAKLDDEERLNALARLRTHSRMIQRRKLVRRDSWRLLQKIQ